MLRAADTTSGHSLVLQSLHSKFVAENSQLSLAIFDLDNTLLAGDSDHAWGQYLVDQGIVDAETYKKANDRFMQEYLDGQLDMNQYLEFSLAPLAAHPMDDLLRWRQHFVETCIAPMMLPKAKALLEQHRQQGHYLMIITATNRFITEPIAELLGVDELIATDPELLDGAYTGRVQGTPSFREGKVIRLQNWLQENPHDLKNAWFYSDSHNDLPLLEQVGNPVAVDADQTLHNLAVERGWQVISLRE